LENKYGRKLIFEKKEVSGIRGGWNWLRTISNSRGYSGFSYVSSVAQLKPTYCLK
jgi:hypothetical protein